MGVGIWLPIHTQFKTKRPEAMHTLSDPAPHTWIANILDCILFNWVYVVSCTINLFCSQYVYFGIEFYGECWAGIYDNATIEKQQTYPELCYEAKFNYSVGKVYSVYIYKFLPGNLVLKFVGRKKIILRIMIIISILLLYVDIDMWLSECCKLVNGIWSAWQPWSSCSSLCGKGTKTRTRSCSPPLWGGHYCLEQNKSVAECQGTTCLGKVALFSIYLLERVFVWNNMLMSIYVK